MKILFDHSSPFLLAHGGVQIQIEQTKGALEKLGVAVEWMRWWDPDQTGDIIHFFGVAPVDYIERSRRKSINVIQTVFFSETCNRSDLRLRIQGAIVRGILAMPGALGIKRQLHWKSFVVADMNVVGLEAERHVLKLVYGVPDEKLRVVPLGLSSAFLNVDPGSAKDDYLVTTGAINAVKRSIELAKMALAGRVPILFVGKPYDERDSYWKKFESMIDNRFVKYQEHVSDEAVMSDILRKARGFVIYSQYENWCLSAHEAAACGLPLLLPHKRWAIERFGGEATFFQDEKFENATATLLDFYQRCPKLTAARIERRSWADVGRDLIQIYRQFANAS